MPLHTTGADLLRECCMADQQHQVLVKTDLLILCTMPMHTTPIRTAGTNLLREGVGHFARVLLKEVTLVEPAYREVLVVYRNVQPDARQRGAGRSASPLRWTAPLRLPRKSGSKRGKGERRGAGAEKGKEKEWWLRFGMFQGWEAPAAAGAEQEVDGTGGNGDGPDAQAVSNGSGSANGNGVGTGADGFNGSSAMRGDASTLSAAASAGGQVSGGEAAASREGSGASTTGGAAASALHSCPSTHGSSGRARGGETSGGGGAGSEGMGSDSDRDDTAGTAPGAAATNAKTDSGGGSGRGRVLVPAAPLGAAGSRHSPRSAAAAAGMKAPIQIQVYRDIPLPDWKLVLPDKLLQFRPLDLVRTDLFALVGLAAVLVNARYDSVVLEVVTLVSAGAFLVRVVLGYQRMAERYRSYVNEVLQQRTLASGEGAIEFLANRWGLWGDGCGLKEGPESRCVMAI